MADVEAQIHSLLEHQPASTTANVARLPPTHGAAPPLASTTANSQTINPTDSRPPIAAIPISQANDRLHANVPPSQIAANQAKQYGDSSDAVWSMYLTEAEKQDKDEVENWKGDTDGILVFTGLFSATVATFIIESYHNLSPNPSDTTNVLLSQITQQLVNISTGSPLTIVVAQDNQPFKPTASTVRVNVLWFFSLVLSLTCALSATLMQQWARRYQELAHSHGAPHRRGRIRAYIFDGIRKFGMTRAVATMPLLLHISVFLFFVGLVEFLFPTNTTVSYSTLALVVAFALAYAIITISPNLYLNCPYATPLSGVTWRLSQLFVIVGLKAALGIEAIFHNPILKLWSRFNRHVAELSIESWMKALKDKVEVHRYRFSGGLRKSIEHNAKEASTMVVPSALEWTLTTLDEDKEIEKFAAGVPGLFDSHTIPHATILTLMAIKPLTDAIFGYRLYDLLKTCFLGTSPLKDDDRRSRLRACLKCLWYFGRAYHKLQSHVLLPSYFSLTIVSPEIIRSIHAEPDPLSCVIGLCFGALIITKLAADVRSRTNSNIPLQVSEDELACLRTFLNADRDDVTQDVTFCLGCPGIVELASMVSLASGAVDCLKNEDVMLDALTLGQETLDILSPMAELHIDQPITQLYISEGKFDRIIVLPLLTLLQTCIMISGTSGFATDLRRSCLRMCMKSLWYCAKAYHQSGSSKPLPSHFPLILAKPEIIRYIQAEEDLASRVMGLCFCALVVMKLAADARSYPDSEVQLDDDGLACLSILLGTKSDDVRLCLESPGAVQLAALVSLALGDLGSLNVSTLLPDVLDVAYQTLTFLSQSLPTGEALTPQLDRSLAQLNIPNGEFVRPIVSRLHHHLQSCFMISGTSALTAEVRRSCLRMCLKSLWHCAKSYHQPGPSTLMPSYFFLDFATPEITSQTKMDPVAYIIGRCFQSLVVNKLAADIKASTESDNALGFLSEILGIGCDNLNLWLEQPGAIELVNAVVLAFDDIGFSATDTVPSYVLDVIPQTFRILSQAFPVETDIGLGLVQIEAHADIPDGTAPVPGEVFRNHSIRSLKNLWYHLRAFSQPENSVPLPSYVLFAFASPALTHRMRMAGGLANGVMGRCVEALVVMELLTSVKLSSNSSVQIRNNRLAWLSAILDTEIDDMKFCLEWPGVVELATIVSLALGDVGPMTVNELPSDVRGVAHKSLTVLYQTAEQHLDRPISESIIWDEVFDQDIAYGIRKILEECKSNSSSLPAEVRRSCQRMCLRSLWYCAKAYLRPGTPKPLPSYFPSMLASPEITVPLKDEQDLSRVVGRCLSALVIMKLVADVRSRPDPYSQANREELLCFATTFDKEWFAPDLMSHLSEYWHCDTDELREGLRPLGAIDLINVVFFACDHSGFLLADTERVPSYVVDVIRQTLSIISQALPAEINTKLELDQMYSRANVISDRLTPSIGEIYRHYSIKCLTNLWCRLHAYHRLGSSATISSNVLTTFHNKYLNGYLTRAQDDATVVMGLCIKALAVAADVRPSISPSDQMFVNEQLVEWFSTIFHAKEDDVKYFLTCRGTAELANMVTIISRVGVNSSGVNALPPEVHDVAQQTLSILSRTANLHDQPIAELDISDGKFDRIVVSGLRNLLHKCIPGSSTLTTDVRGGCLRISLKCLWYCATYQQIDASEPSSAYSFSTLDVVSPEFIHIFQTEQDRDSRVIARCIGALAVVKLMPDVRSRSDPNSQIGNDELTCLSTILGTGSDDVKYCLELPGAVILATIASLAFGDFGPFGEYGWDEEVKAVASGTLDIISQVLPAENTVGLRPFTWDDIFNGNLARVVVSSLHRLFQVDDAGPSDLIANVRRSSLRMCLRSLWYCAKAYHQPSISTPLTSYFPSTLASPEIIRLIHVEQDPISRATGRCFGALVVAKLAANTRLRADSNLQISDEELTCLSSILGAGIPELERWLSQNYAVELANILSLIFSEIDSFSDTGHSEAPDKIQQTYSILYQTLPAELNAELTKFTTDGTSESSESPSEPTHERQLHTCLEKLWHCARTYNRLEIAVPLPSFVGITLTDPEFTRRIHSKGDLTIRVTGRCIQALIVNKLVDSISSSSAAYGEEMGWVSSLLGTEPDEFSRQRRPTTVTKLHNVINLMSSEIESLFTLETPRADVLKIVQQTLEIISSDLTQGGAFDDGDVPKDQVLLMHNICSKIANNRGANQFTSEAAGILEQLEQISKQNTALLMHHDL